MVLLGVSAVAGQRDYEVLLLQLLPIASRLSINNSTVTPGKSKGTTTLIWAVTKRTEAGSIPSSYDRYREITQYTDLALY